MQAGGAEFFVMGSDDRVGTAGDERCHEESGAHGGATAGDGAAAARHAAVAIDWSDADQGGDLAAGAAAEFGQIGDQRAQRGRTDPGNALQEVGIGGPSWVVADGVVDVAVQLGQFGLQQREVPFDRPDAPALVGPRLRLPSATIISMTWRRRATSSPKACAAGSSSGRDGGRTASAKWAIAAASRRSVLASLPVARAKSRIWRGLTTASGRWAAAIALATTVS